MSLSDPIADMLTRIRNGSRVRKKSVNVKASNVCKGIAKVLEEEGYIQGFDFIDDGKQGFLRVELKYSVDGDPVITELERISKPCRRWYSGVKQMPKSLEGLGVIIVSTSKGVLSDNKCRENNLGGELLCMVS
jgi:small subunit ribosomal protein S8